MFWGFKEMRWMVAMCGVIIFALLVLPTKIEITHNLRLTGVEKVYNPIKVEISR